MHTITAIVAKRFVKMIFKINNLQSYETLMIIRLWSYGMNYKANMFISSCPLTIAFYTQSKNHDIQKTTLLSLVATMYSVKPIPYLILV